MEARGRKRNTKNTHVLKEDVSVVFRKRSDQRGMRSGEISSSGEIFIRRHFIYSPS